MLQLVALLVAVYAMARLIQAPFQIDCGRNGIPALVRLIVVAVVSAGSVLVILILLSMILDTGSHDLRIR